MVILLLINLFFIILVILLSAIASVDRKFLQESDVRDQLKSILELLKVEGEEYHKRCRRSEKILVGNSCLSFYSFPMLATLIIFLFMAL